MEESKIYLFGPKNKKDLKHQYPELGNFPEFKNLTTAELLFVWWYANQTSPLVTDDNLSDKMRIAFAFTEAFGTKSNDAVYDKRKTDYYSSNFPSHISIAIDVMRSFNPTVRARSRMMVEKILANYEKLVDIKISDFETKNDDGSKEINWTGRNNYVTSTKNISDTLPQLINQVEQGFGVSDNKGEEEGSLKAIHRFHSTNKE